MTTDPHAWQPGAPTEMGYYRLQLQSGREVKAFIITSSSRLGEFVRRHKRIEKPKTETEATCKR